MKLHILFQSGQSLKCHEKNCIWCTKRGEKEKGERKSQKMEECIISNF